MIRPADSDEETQQSDEDDGRAVAVKDDPQFTLAVTRGMCSIQYLVQRFCTCWSVYFEFMGVLSNIYLEFDPTDY